MTAVKHSNTKNSRERNSKEALLQQSANKSSNKLSLSQSNGRKRNSQNTDCAQSLQTSDLEVNGASPGKKLKYSTTNSNQSQKPKTIEESESRAGPSTQAWSYPKPIVL